MDYSEFKGKLDAIFANSVQELEAIAVKWAEKAKQANATEPSQPVSPQSVSPQSVSPQSVSPQSVPIATREEKVPRDYFNHLKTTLQRFFRPESTQSHKLTIAEYLRAKKIVEHIVERSMERLVEQSVVGGDKGLPLLPYDKTDSEFVRELAGQFLKTMQDNITQLVMSFVRQNVEAGAMNLPSNDSKIPHNPPKDDLEIPPSLSQEEATLRQEHPDVDPDYLYDVLELFDSKDDNMGGKVYFTKPVKNRKAATDQEKAAIAKVFLWFTEMGLNMSEDNVAREKMEEITGGNWGRTGFYFNLLYHAKGPAVRKIFYKKVKASLDRFQGMQNEEVIANVIKLGHEAFKQGSVKKKK